MTTLYCFGPNFGMPDPSPFVMKSLVHLKMSGLPFDARIGDMRKAPKGKLPYLQDGDQIIPDSAFIADYLKQKHAIDFDAGLSPEQRAIGWAFEKMCEEHLYWAVVDARWSTDSSFDKGPRVFFDVVPALIRPLVIAKVRRDIRRTLHGQGFGRHKRGEIEQLAARDFEAISDFLGAKDYLFGAEPHGADASVYAAVASAMCPLFETPIRESAGSHANLVAYTQRCTARWFPEFA